MLPPLTDIFLPPAAVKIRTEKDIAGIREACRLGRLVLDKAHAAIKPGVLTDEIDRIVSPWITGQPTHGHAWRSRTSWLHVAASTAAGRPFFREACALLVCRPPPPPPSSPPQVHEATIELGAYPSPYNYFNFPKSVCTSINEVICHGIPDRRPLREGDIVNVDVSVYYRGYHGEAQGCRGAS